MNNIEWEGRAKHRVRLIRFWARLLDVSRRTAVRWFDTGLRPAFAPVAEGGPLLRFSEAAERLGVQPQALRKYVRRLQCQPGSALKEIRIVAVPWIELRKTTFTYMSAAGLMLSGSATPQDLGDAVSREAALVDAQIAVGVKPLVRLSRAHFARFLEARPRRLAHVAGGWIEATVAPDEGDRHAAGEGHRANYVVFSPEEARAIRKAGVEAMQDVQPLLIATPPRNTNMGAWLAALARGMPVGKDEVAVSRCCIRISDRLLLRLSFPNKDGIPVSVEFFGRRTRTARRIVIEFDDGTREILRPPETTGEKGGGDHGTQKA